MSITVYLTRKALMREGACLNGLALFDSIKESQDEERANEGKPPRRGLVVRWTPLHALWLATAYPAFYDWLTDKGLIPLADLKGACLARAFLARACLARADLKGADLSLADLSRADLKGANLVGACLARADLKGADLYGADLYEADLAGGNLAWATLARACLARADLKGACLARADLKGADLYGACLDGARRRRTDPAIEGWDAVGAECDCCVYLFRASKGGA